MKRFIILTIIGVFTFCISCKNDPLEQVNPNGLSEAVYYRTGDQIVTAVNAVYSSLQALQLFTREYYFLHDLRSDEMQPGGAQLEAQRAQILGGFHRPDNGVITSVWQGWYRVIHQANLVIEKAPGATERVTDELKNRVIGEAKFLRGWAYFDLVIFWGGVPLMTSVAQTPEANKGRATEEEVYSQIIADLTDAIASLPAKSDYPESEIGRASKEAAQAMLARVYMQRGQYAEARVLLQDIIQSGKFSLVPNYIENFQDENEFNQESLWEVAFTEAFGSYGWSGSGEGQSNEATIRGQEYGPTAWRNIIPSNSLLAEYESVEKGDEKDDPRYKYSFYFIGDTYNNGQDIITEMQGAEPKVSWKKYQRIYKAPTEDFRSGINFRVIRYAEVLLMMAECENELGGHPLKYLNEVRAREGVEMPPYPTTRYPAQTKQQIMDAINHEKRVELAGEQIRNRDILRWRKLGKLSAEPLPYFDPSKALLPIPQQEINNNDKIDQADQNPGY